MVTYHFVGFVDKEGKQEEAWFPLGNVLYSRLGYFEKAREKVLKTWNFIEEYSIALAKVQNDIIIHGITNRIHVIWTCYKNLVKSGKATYQSDGNRCSDQVIVNFRKNEEAILTRILQTMSIIDDDT
jgi:hypothetical protein